MSAEIHIFTATKQCAWDYTDPYGPQPQRVQHSPVSLARCNVCGRRRQRRNLYIQCYYDKTVWSCRHDCRRGHSNAPPSQHPTP